MKNLIVLIVLIGLGSVSGFAQNPPNPPNPQPTPNQREIVERERLEQQRKVTENIISREKGINSDTLPKVSRTYRIISRKKITKEQRAILEPGAADVAAHAQFLAQPNTGIFRLLPDLGCEKSTYVVDASRDCLNQIPESAYYSFREREHTAEYLSDIRFVEDILYSDGVLAQSIFVSLGDIPLEKISLETDALEFINKYQPQTLNSDALKQFNEMKLGIKVGNYSYRKSQTAVENTTYALRVIAYRGKLFKTLNGSRYNLVKGDNRMDLTVAFRILRKEKDGSLLIIWKELKRAESPKVEYSN